MKNYILIVLISVISFKSYSSDFILEYTEGNIAGQEVTHTGWLGYESACYNGNPWKARKALKDMAFDDIEKIGIYVWYNKETKDIEFSYVDTKCLDDSLDATYESCSAEVIIPKC